jgi:hypothetical protein
MEKTTRDYLASLGRHTLMLEGFATEVASARVPARLRSELHVTLEERDLGDVAVRRAQAPSRGCDLACSRRQAISAFVPQPITLFKCPAGFQGYDMRSPPCF